MGSRGAFWAWCPGGFCAKRKTRGPLPVSHLRVRGKGPGAIPRPRRSRWSPGFRGISQVRGRPANAGGGLRGCVLELRGSVSAGAASPQPPFWVGTAPGQRLIASAPVGSGPFELGRPCCRLGPLPKSSNPLLAPPVHCREVLSKLSDMHGIPGETVVLGPVGRSPLKAFLEPTRPGCTEQVRMLSVKLEAVPQAAGTHQRGKTSDLRSLPELLGRSWGWKRKLLSELLGDLRYC